MILPILTNKLYHVKHWKNDSADDSAEPEGNTTEVTSLDEANVVSSKHRKLALTFDGEFPDCPFKEQEVHSPVLDIDVPAALVPSSTPGHSHLYLAVPLTWDDYQKLLDVLADVGILEPGYVAASKARGYTAVRLPWIHKL